MRNAIINIMLFIVGVALSRIYFFLVSFFISNFFEIEDSTGISLLMFYLYFIVAIPLILIILKKIKSLLN